MNFPDMIITDENNNILFCQDKNVFTDYCSQYNLNHIWGNTNDSYINSGSNYYIKSNDKDDINFIYNIYAKNFPKSKKIKIKFNKIIIAENEDLEQDNGIQKQMFLKNFMKVRKYIIKLKVAVMKK